MGLFPDLKGSITVTIPGLVQLAGKCHFCEKSKFTKGENWLWRHGSEWVWGSYFVLQ